MIAHLRLLDGDYGVFPIDRLNHCLQTATLAYRDHPCYERAREFVDLYDNPAFDPEGEILPLEFFEPMLRRVFARPKNSLYQRAVERVMQDV